MNTSVELVRAERISSLPGITPALTKILTSAYVTANQTVPSQLGIVVGLLEKDIRQFFHVLTLDEVSHAIHMGIRGEYTERTDISNANIYQWLKAWKNSQERMVALSAKNVHNALPEKGTITDDEKRQSSINHVLRTFDQYERTGDFTDFGNAAYLFLESVGLINYPKNRKVEIYNKALRSVVKKLDSEARSSGSLAKMRQAKSLIEKISNTRDDVVVVEARRLALMEYFDNLIEMQEDLPELLSTI
jgi:hypothetical protein